MHNFTEEKIFPTSAKNLYDVVLDIESYPLFLPWCDGARIIIEDESQIIAELVVQFKGFSEKYQSIITPTANKAINVTALSSGPFKSLVNTWNFTELENNHCRVNFFIEFELKSILLDKLMGGFFSQAVSEMVNSFEARITKLYNL